MAAEEMRVPSGNRRHALFFQVGPRAYKPSHRLTHDATVKEAPGWLF